MSKLSVTFWGVRGSVPSPGSQTSTYGGNTACVEVRASSELIIIDAGSGLRPLGASLGAAPVSGTLLLSHYHWDHIQGLPFFGPAYNPACTFEILGASREGHDVRELLAGQMTPPYFPVSMSALNANLTFRAVAHGDRLSVRGVSIEAFELNHPNGALGYRLEHGGRTLVYASDNEHSAESDERLARLASGADLLIYDAMYTPAEYRGERGGSKIGWGHSTWEAAVATARRAGVRSLVLFHHDPGRSDSALEQMLGEARRCFADTRIAREGESIEL